jgi:hypothetical protein
MNQHSDCTIVDPSIRLQDLKQWRINSKESIPFYLSMGDSGGLVFNDNPDIVRQLIKIYNKQKLFFNIKLVSFLNTEGIAARIVSTPVDDVLGYRAELSNN